MAPDVHYTNGMIINCQKQNRCPLCSKVEQCTTVHLGSRHLHSDCWECASALLVRREELRRPGMTTLEAALLARAERQKELTSRGGEKT